MVGEIRAAGGVVWREDTGVPRVALIHRERYGDWTLPKGKLLAGEPELRAAVREVAEETGARVAVTRRLSRVGYFVEQNTPKTVAFWAMRYLSGEFVANDEVDALQWVALPQARDMVSYDVDRSVLDAFTAVPIPLAVVALVRHAKAGSREKWAGDDRMRPLSKAGRRQAQRLAGFLRAFAPERIVSADRVRCLQTVEPLAELTGQEIEVVRVFADEAYVDDPEATRAEVLAIAKSTQSAVICSQGTTIPGLVQDFAPHSPPESVSTRKAAAWVLAFAEGGDVVSTDYYPDAAS